MIVDSLSSYPSSSIDIELFLSL